MEMENRTHVVLLCVQHLLVVGAAQEGQHHTVCTQGGLDHVGDVFLVGLIVKVGHVLTGGVLMLGQVVIGTVSDAPQLTPAEGEQELHVCGGLAVEAQLLFIVVAVADLILFQTQGEQPIQTELLPVSKPLQIRIRLAEELQLHLLKLSGTEGKVARGDLVSEGLSDLADTEGQLLSGGTLHVLKVYENTLGCLGTQVHGVLGVLGDTLEGLEHQIKLTDIGKIVLAAGGAGDLMLLDEVHHLLLAPGVHAALQGDALLLAVILDELIRPETLVALLTVHQRVGESAQMAGGNPGLGIHQDGAVNTHIVGALLDKFLPPGALYVIFQLHAQIPVIPGIGKSSVDLGSRIDKPSGLGQRNNFLHRFFHSFHSTLSPLFMINMVFPCISRMPVTCRRYKLRSP